MTETLVERSAPEPDPEPALSLALDSERAGEVLSALGSETARAILAALREEPRTLSALAETVDTSLPNARHHVDRMLAAGVVEQVDTWYSSRGQAMPVYAPATEAFVLAPSA